MRYWRVSNRKNMTICHIFSDFVKNVIVFVQMCMLEEKTTIRKYRTVQNEVNGVLSAKKEIDARYSCQ